jgi:benzylsuccinate CoA-transferase BbsF subunit
LLVAALLASRRTGRGVTIDLAQIEGTAATLGVTYLETSINHDNPAPKGNHYGSAAPHGCYPCRGEDRWCVISVRTEQEWRSFCAVIERPDLTDDPRFLSLDLRIAHRRDLDTIAQEWTQPRSAEEVMDKMQAAGVPAGVVQNGADLLKDAQLRHRNYFASFADSLIGPFEIPRSGFLFRGTREAPLRLPSRFGSDNEAILRELLGYDEATIAQWRAEEVLA